VLEKKQLEKADPFTLAVCGFDSAFIKALCLCDEIKLRAIRPVFADSVTFGDLLNAVMIRACAT